MRVSDGKSILTLSAGILNSSLTRLLIIVYFNYKSLSEADGKYKEDKSSHIWVPSHCPEPVFCFIIFL